MFPTNALSTILYTACNAIDKIIGIPICIISLFTGISFILLLFVILILLLCITIRNGLRLVVRIKKTSSKTGFTLVCYSFVCYYIGLFFKCQMKICYKTIPYNHPLLIRFLDFPHFLLYY